MLGADLKAFPARMGVGPQHYSWNDKWVARSDTSYTVDLLVEPDSRVCTVRRGNFLESYSVNIWVLTTYRHPAL